MSLLTDIKIETEAKGQGEVTHPICRMLALQRFPQPSRAQTGTYQGAPASVTETLFTAPTGTCLSACTLPLATFPIHPQPTTMPGCHFHLEMTQGFPRSLRTRPLPPRPMLMAPFPPHAPTLPCENTASQEAPCDQQPLRIMVSLSQHRKGFVTVLRFLFKASMIPLVSNTRTLFFNYM